MKWHAAKCTTTEHVNHDGIPDWWEVRWRLSLSVNQARRGCEPPPEPEPRTGPPTVENLAPGAGLSAVEVERTNAGDLRAKHIVFAGPEEMGPEAPDMYPDD